MNSYRVVTPRNGGPRGRPTLLYRRWKDICQRVKGRASKCPWRYEGLPLFWKSFGEFRAWAIKNGFSKENCSPDRKIASLGYVPGNVQFVTKKQNYASSRGGLGGSDDEVRGREPPEGEGYYP